MKLRNSLGKGMSLEPVYEKSALLLKCKISFQLVNLSELYYISSHDPIDTKLMSRLQLANLILFERDLRRR